MPTPVVIVTSNGRPVSNVAGGVPMTPVEASVGGEPVILVDSGGEPVTLVNADLSLWSSFSPEDLFASSEVGGWYDPSDLTSLYQSRTGGSIVDADAQSVGIMLDKRLMGGATAAAFIAAQTELVTNGGFDSGTNWTLDANATISGGKLNVVGSISAAVNVAVWGTNVDAGWYAVTYTIESITGAVSLNLTASVGGTVRSSPGTYTDVLYTGSAGSPRIQSRSSGVSAAVIDNVSVKAIPGSHMIAPSDAARPLYKTSGGLHWLQPDGVDDWMVPGSALNLGETWSHVGGWLASALFDAAFTTSNNIRSCLLSDATAVANGWLWRNQANSSYVSLLAGDVSAAHIVSLARASTTSMSARRNGGSASTLSVYDDSADTQGLALFTRQNAAFDSGLTGRFYGGLWIARAFTGTERADLESYFAEKAGVTL